MHGAISTTAPHTIAAYFFSKSFLLKILVKQKILVKYENQYRARGRNTLSTFIKILNQLNVDESLCE
jgi:hypothetical protein